MDDSIFKHPEGRGGGGRGGQGRGGQGGRQKFWRGRGGGFNRFQGGGGGAGNPNVRTKRKINFINSNFVKYILFNIFDFVSAFDRFQKERLYRSMLFMMIYGDII